MDSKIVKPMSIIRSEFISTLTQLINGCGLPSFVIEAVLRDACNEMHIIAQKELSADIQNYQKELNDVRSHERS